MNSERAVAFAGCMRANGVLHYPDPNSSNAMAGGLPKVSPQQLGVSTSRFDTAKHACAYLLPGGQGTEAPSSEILNKLVNFAGCMRSHGVQNWPDPTPVSPQAPPGAPPYTFNLQGLPGLDGHSLSLRVTTTLNECFRLTHLTDAQVPWSG